MAQVNPLHYLDALIASIGTSDSATAEGLTKVKDLFSKRLWHEFSLTLLELVQSNANVRQASLDMHQHLLVPTRLDISSDVYIKLVYLACRTGDPSLAEGQNDLLSLLDGAIAQFMQTGNKQAVNALRCIRAIVMMTHGPSLEAKRILTDVDDAIKRTPVQDLNVVLQAFFHRGMTRLHELMQDFDSYYPTAFSFATYGQSAGLPVIDAEQEAVAYMTAFAALLSKRIYNFGRLLNFEPYTKALERTDEKWILDLVRLCNSGDVKAYESFMAAKASMINSIEPLKAAAQTTLLRKVRLMALLHLVFHTPADKRVFPLSAVAKRCEVSEAEVEPLLLQAFALDLIRGKIDGLDQTVDVTWVQPRVLSLEEVKQLAASVSAWRKVVQETAKNVAETAADIVK